MIEDEMHGGVLGIIFISFLQCFESLLSGFGPLLVSWLVDGHWSSWRSTRMHCHCFSVALDAISLDQLHTLGICCMQQNKIHESSSLQHCVLMSDITGNSSSLFTPAIKWDLYPNKWSKKETIWSSTLGMALCMWGTGIIAAVWELWMLLTWQVIAENVLSIYSFSFKRGLFASGANREDDLKELHVIFSLVDFRKNNVLCIELLFPPAFGTTGPLPNPETMSANNK